MNRARRLVGISEIAEELHTSRQAVANWRARDHTFPAPLAELRMGPVWRLGQVLRWAQGSQSGRRLSAETRLEE